MIRYVAGIVLSPDKSKIALVLKNRPAWQAGMYNAIGGKIEENEEPINAVIREVYEETSVMTSITEWVDLDSELDENYELYWFKCICNEFDNLKTNTDELIEIFDIDELPDNVIDGLKQMISKALM